MKKIPYGLKVTGKAIRDGKVYYRLKLKWWFALYTAFISCFTAAWYAEDALEIEGEENN